VKRNYHTLDDRGKINERKLALFVRQNSQQILPMVEQASPVQNLRTAAGEDDVAGLKVAMHDSGMVPRIQGTRELNPQPQRFLIRRSGLQYGGSSLPSKQFKEDVTL
jgi:hypothetical protein